MNGLKLFEVDESIRNIFDNEESYNPETGELTVEADRKLKALELGKEQLQKSFVDYFFETKAFKKVIEDEKKRLSDLEKATENKILRIKQVLDNSLNGEKAKIGTHSLYYMNTESVETDPVSFSAEKLYKTNPDLVKVTYEIEKKKTKEYYKQTGIMPENVAIKQNRTLVIR